MALILTFLGKGGVGRTTIAIATAKRFAAQGKRVLFAGQEPAPVLGLMLGTTPTADPLEIAPRLSVVHSGVPFHLQQPAQMAGHLRG